MQRLCSLLLCAGLLWAIPASAQITLTWDPVAGAAYYQMQGCEIVPPASTCTTRDLPDARPTAPPWTDTAVLAGKTYRYTVAACESAGPCSGPSNTVQVPLGAPVQGAPTNLVATALIPQGALSAQADSQELVGEAADASKVLDGNPATFWHTQWQGSQPPYQHWLLLRLPQEWWVKGLRVLPRQDQANSRIKAYRIEAGPDDSRVTVITSGSFAPGTAWQTITFPQPVLARVIVLYALSSHNGLPFAGAAEVQLIQGTQP